MPVCFRDEGTLVCNYCVSFFLLTGETCKRMPMWLLCVVAISLSFCTFLAAPGGMRLFHFLLCHIRENAVCRENLASWAIFCKCMRRGPGSRITDTILMAVDRCHQQKFWWSLLQQKEASSKFLIFRGLIAHCVWNTGFLPRPVKTKWQRLKLSAAIDSNGDASDSCTK